jgi:hypothetical protein
VAFPRFPTNDDVAALKRRAESLADELDVAAAVLRDTGGLVPDGLVDSLVEFAEDRRRLGDALGFTESDVAFDTLTAAIDRAVLARRASRIAATQPGYEAAVSSLHTCAAGTLENPEQFQAVARVLAAIEGNAKVTAIELADVQAQLRAAGLDDMVAIGLLAGHLVLEPETVGPHDRPRADDESESAATVADLAADQPRPRGAHRRNGTAVVDGVAEAPDKPKGSRQTGPASETETLDVEATLSSDELHATRSAKSEPELEPRTDPKLEGEPDPEAQPEPELRTSTSPAPAILYEDADRPDAQPAAPRTEAPPAVDAAPSEEQAPSVAPHVERPLELVRELNAAILDAVDAGDMPMAAQLARAVENLGERPPLPASGLAAFTLAAACNAPDDDVAVQYEEEALDGLTGEISAVPAALTHAAAALRASIRLPYGNAPEILRAAAGPLQGALSDLCLLIGENAPRGEMLQPGRDRAVAREATATEEKLAAVRAQAAERYERAKHEQHKYRPAGAVWRRLVYHGPIGEILQAIGSGDEPSDEIRALIDRFGDPRELDREIDETFRAVRRLGREKIEASARQWIRRNAARSLEVARAWMALVDARANGASAGAEASRSWLRQRVQELSAAVTANLDEIEIAGDRGQTLAAGLFRREWAALEGHLVRGEDLRRTIEPPTAVEVLGVPLARATTLEIDGRFELVDASVEAVAEALLLARRTPWESAFDARLEQRAHHLTRVALAYVMPERRNELAERRADHLAKARRALAELKDDVRKRVDAALRDQVLTDADHSELTVRVHAVDAEAEDLASERRALDAVSARIASATSERCADLRAEIDNLELPRGQVRKLRKLLEVGELAVAAEHVARFRAGEREITATTPRAVGVASFADYCDRHATTNLVDVLRASRAHERDLHALHSLLGFAARPGVRDVKASNVFRVLVALGLEPSEPEPSERVANSMVAFEVDVHTIDGVCPVPDFGSRSKGRYRVVVVGGDIAERDVVARIKALQPRTGSPVVVLTGDPLPTRRRHALAQLAVQEHVPFLVVDPIVLAFVIAGAEEGSRTERFFGATLPFTWTNPYVTHGAVPPEMFFGREAELQALLDPSGSAFIYGGRQLGKSALLMKALTDIHAPARGRCAVYLDLDSKRIGHGASTDRVWSHIGSELERAIPGATVGRDEEAVAAFVLEWLGADAQRRLLVLLDETDHFLEQEADRADDRARMHNVIAMRELMRAADGRLKFVLAGLHSVQRFLHLPNQPLAQLGAPTPIGPLSWEHAARLVEEPMRALGYAFDEHVVDRILTLTSRHPSLIQHVCRALVDHLARKPRRQLPLAITLRDLDDVYEDRDLRREIRKRFDWTLDLDPHYRVLAYTLAYESITLPELRANGLTATELQQEARRWWPEGFDGQSRDEIVTLCDEMVQLRVFVEDEGRYRLWSPNILQLLGTKSEIESRLLSDEGRDRARTLDASRDRRPLAGPSDPQRSPLTYADEQRVLEPSGPRVRLILGTSATRVEGVIEALEHAAGSPDWPQIETRRHARVPAVRDLHGTTARGTVVHLAPVHGVADDWLQRRVIDLAEGAGSSHVVVLVLGDDTVDLWDELVAGLELDVEHPGAFRDVTLKRWDVDALRFWLDDVQMPVTSRAERERVLAATGGWPLLLDRFLQTAHQHDRQLEATLSAVGEDRTWGDGLAEALQLARLEPLGDAARVLAQAGGPMDAATLAEWSEGRFSLVGAQQMLETLVLAQAASQVSADHGLGVELEPSLAAILRAGQS